MSNADIGEVRAPSGAQPSSASVCLAFNENPESVASAVKLSICTATDRINRYPFADEARVIRKVAVHFDCPEENLMLVRGIDECFDRVCAEFSSMRFVTAWPGFDGYRGRIRANGLAHFEIGLGPDLMLREQDVLQVTRNDFVVLANPSNPTGLALTSDQVALLRQRAGKVLLDETYIDYSSRRGSKPGYGTDTLSFRSFSKSYGLAGLRLGVVFGAADVIAAMKQKQWFCNVGVLDLHALEAAIEHDQARDVHVRKTLHERERVTGRLRELGYAVAPSEANFVLLRHADTPALLRFLLDKAIHVKDAGQFGLDGHLRISIGSPEDNSHVLAALADYSHT